MIAWRVACGASDYFICMYLEIRDPTVIFFAEFLEFQLNSELEFDARVVENCLVTPSHPGHRPLFCENFEIISIDQIVSFGF